MAIATEKAAADDYVIMVLIAAIVFFNQTLQTRMDGKINCNNSKNRENGYYTVHRVHMGYFEKYIEIRIKRNKGTKRTDILEACLKKTTVEECLKIAVDNKLMKIKEDADKEKNWYFDDSLVINGVKINGLSSQDASEYVLKSAEKANNAINARILAEKAFTS